MVLRLVMKRSTLSKFDVAEVEDTDVQVTMSGTLHDLGVAWKYWLKHFHNFDKNWEYDFR